jgi:dihydrolipoamide dehydrogenase
MNTLHVDVAVIGAGTAGLAAFRAAKSHGKRAVLIEGGPYGTTCARVGCMPSKLLIAAAEAAHAIGEAPGFGVHADNLRIDGRAVMARVRAERDRFVGFVLEGVERIPENERLRGFARFLDATRLQVDEHTVVHAERFVIATGSRPQIPPVLRDAGKRLVVNDDVFEWEDLPESVAVVGTGVIGLELGQALQRLGVRVAVFGRSARIAQLSDLEVIAVAARTLGQEFDLRLHTTILSAHDEGERVRFHYRDTTGEEHVEHFRYVLAAAGREPNVKNLGLEHTGLELDRHGIPLYDKRTMQCGASAIFIAGDANHERPLLHEAADQGRIAGDNAALFPAVHTGLRRAPLDIAFTDPQIAVAGRAWSGLCADDGSGAKIACGIVSFEDQGRSRVMRQNRGVLRVYGEYGSNRFLGAEMIGPRAEHYSHLLAWAYQNGMTVQAMLEMPFYHPVIEEGVRTALRDLNEKLLRGLPEIERCTDCTPGI